MTDPITPPPELVVEWADTIYQQTECDDQRDLYVATRAAQWGADQELDACCNWLDYNCPSVGAVHLRAARRPKPPSLKEQALEILQRLSKDGFPCNYQEDSDWDTLRRALEALPE